MGEELEFSVGEDQDEARPLVPAGRYEAQYVGYDVKPFMGGKKLYIKLEIVTPGPHYGKRLFRAYNLYAPKLPPGSDLYKDFVLLYGQRVRKNAKLSVALFKGKILAVRVKEVKLNRNQIPLAEHQKYSVVDAILGIVVGAKQSGAECLPRPDPVPTPIPKPGPVPVPSSPPRKLEYKGS